MKALVSLLLLVTGLIFVFAIFEHAERSMGMHK